MVRKLPLFILTGKQTPSKKMKPIKNNLVTYTIDLLKQFCFQRDLLVSGKKCELIYRLVEYEIKQGFYPVISDQIKRVIFCKSCIDYTYDINAGICVSCDIDVCVKCMPSCTKKSNNRPCKTKDFCKKCSTKLENQCSSTHDTYRQLTFHEAWSNTY